MAYLFILGTLICLVDIFASFIINLVTKSCFPESREDQAMRRDLIAIKKEMGNISMVDEFAKYAKLQRKYNKLESEVKEKTYNRSVSRTKLRLPLVYGIRIVNGLFTIILLYLYRREPVVIFPKGMLWPLEGYLSWPTAIDSCISLPIWISLMKLTVSSYNRIVA